MPDTLDLTLAGEPVRLLADRALYWPARDRLLVADLHLGKGDTFRAAGIAVPSGGTAHDLARLDALLALTSASSLWILGDFLHARRHAAVDAAWRAFREAHREVAMAVVPGNHDRAFDADVAGVARAREGHVEPPFEFRHAPPHKLVPDRHVLCGHVHPVLRLPPLGRHPLFWLRPGITVLPAFSAFTGGHPVPRADSAGSVLCNGRQLVRLA
ncbi:ligase-associated DNA damage response endonuclease PdeM [Luteimonas viscosa]|uniref:Ligase-associated DNA damage response endonuclease PdeM n=1 Tax=Luteimonas viscosa TaxID=1132694 RepID=A0A5D4XTV8_9GAMM|nr:ligase-associated DNA damage response endonuclease PdeM [Luteimonas viscosa]TYT26422.1 ligase-associated DNA damage response endonuclease PdeM [Luteimonas viscosa]